MQQASESSPTRLSPDARADHLMGVVLRPGDAEYEEARRVWNGMVDRRPAIIARPRDADEVAAAIAYARANGLPLAVRGGGHNAAGLGVCDDGLVVDLALMRHVSVDPSTRTARVGGGATWADFDAAAQAHGLATTGGAISSTGVAGLTLGGGLGWLMRRYGLACDNLLSVDLVTADGRSITASAADNPDLFWALRGGGGNFGVVTSFQFQLHPVGPIVGGMLVHPIDRAVEALRFYRELTRELREDLTVFCAMLTPPGGPPVIAFALAYHGAPEEADAALAAVRRFGPPMADQVGPMTYVQLQQMMDEALPPGLHVYWRAEFLKGLDDDALLETLVARYDAAPSPLDILLIEQMGGAVARVPRTATAFPHRDAPYNLAILSRWTDPADRDMHIRWARETHDAVRPWAGSGVYVNYLGLGESAERVREAYGESHLSRLVTAKDTFDPQNVFRLNQNVPPTGWTADVSARR
jgi:FAD/FMN-containing dehydrogenase